METKLAKFKVGDRVVKVKNTRIISKLGKTFEIASIADSRGIYGICYFPDSGLLLSGEYEDDLELEEVVNSPLYKALK